MSWGSTGTGGSMVGPTSRNQPSRWLWWVPLGCCCLPYAPFIWFIVVAVKVGGRKFWTAAGISFAACSIAYAAMLTWPPAGTDKGVKTEADLSTLHGGLVLPVVWILLLVYWLFLHHDYKNFLRDEADENNLRWHSTQAQAQAFYAPRTGAGSSAPPYVAPTAPGPRVPPAPPVDHLSVQADKYLATQPPGNLPASAPPNAPVD